MVACALLMLVVPMSHTYGEAYPRVEKTARCGSVIAPRVQPYSRSNEARDGCWAKRNNRLIAVIVVTGLGLCCFYGGHVMSRGERDEEASA